MDFVKNTKAPKTIQPRGGDAGLGSGTRQAERI